MKNSLISVVVPIYNVESYLEKCFWSIYEQTYSNIEVWLIDDGSQDNSGTIAERLAQNDARFHVIHKQNGGLSDARNEGLKYAKGEYVTFVDSDDILSPDFIELIFSAMQKEEAQIGIGDFMRITAADAEEVKNPFHSAGSGEETHSKGSFTETVNGEEALVNTYLSKAHGWNFVTWGKIYERSLFERLNLRFPAGKIHEDTYTTYRLLYEASRIVYVDRILYGYVERPKSIMSEAFSKRHMDVVEATQGACNFFIREGNQKLVRLAVNYHIRYLFYLDYRFMQSAVLAPEEYVAFRQLVRSDVNRYVTGGLFTAPKYLAYHIAACCQVRPLLKMVMLET